MAGDNEKDKKGFSGLSGLASEVSGIDDPIKPEPKAESKPPAPKQPFQPQGETASPEPERKSSSSPPPIQTVSSGKSGGGSGGKWILGIICVVFVIWLINNGGQNNKKPSYKPSPSSSQSYSYPQSSPTPVIKTPSTTQSAGLQYTKPSVGANNVLSVPEIRWCIREGIRIEAMRDVIDTNEGIDEFNRIVNDNNSRCGSYRYHQGSQSRAEHDVEAHRSQIVSEAIQKARKFGRSYHPSYPSVSPVGSTTSTPKNPSAQYIKEAQQLLTDLGYDPGPVDGDYGRRTADAVKAFQKAQGQVVDGSVSESLVDSAWKKIKKC